jgi:hypothetical protein
MRYTSFKVAIWVSAALFDNFLGILKSIQIPKLGNSNADSGNRQFIFYKKVNVWYLIKYKVNLTTYSCLLVSFWYNCRDYCAKLIQ